MKYSFSSESVTEGHPDKLADNISDAILDAILAQDPKARVACECLLTTGLVFISGEITTTAYVDIPKIARNVLRKVGYTKGEYGFDADSCNVLCSINEQSPDIAMGVDTGGAGDQGMMFGYASNETDSFMPLPIALAHQLTRRLAEVRHSGLLDFLRPDGKAQVTVRYDGPRALGVERVVLSAQHNPDITQEALRTKLMEHVIQPILKDFILDDCQFFINPTGSFVIGGPPGDCGLTGRKIIVDTYGGMGRHGGGCFSGKDPSKVDRSGAYMARYLAKNLVASGLAQRCEIQIAYAIGVVQPVSFYVNSFGTGTLPDPTLEQKILALVDLSPAGIRDRFELCRPIYQATASYGHFGRNDQDFPWENLDLVESLKA